MIEEIITWLFKFIVDFLGDVITTISPVRIARKLFFDIPLSEDPDGFFATLALWSLDIISLLLVGFGILMLLKSLFS